MGSDKKGGESEEEEPEDVKVGTRVSTVEQLTLDFYEKVFDDSLVNFVKEEEKFIRARE